MADTKAAFLEGFKRPLPGIYSTVIQELLVQQHLFRWNVTYSYNAITALGVVSIFDQLLEGLPEQDPIFEAFIKALQEDPAQYRGDARRLEEAAGSLGGPENLKPDAGNGWVLRGERRGAWILFALCRGLKLMQPAGGLGALA